MGNLLIARSVASAHSARPPGLPHATSHYFLRFMSAASQLPAEERASGNKLLLLRSEVPNANLKLS